MFQGRTRAIHAYEIGQFFTLVDMPGYGENMPSYYDECVTGYLQYRKKLPSWLWRHFQGRDILVFLSLSLFFSLERCFVLIDSTLGVSDVDLEGLQMMEANAVPYAVSSSFKWLPVKP